MTPEENAANTEWGWHTWPRIKQFAAQQAIVLLPVGSVEQHGPALPVNTDTALTWAVCKAATDRLSKDGPVLLVPPVCYGYSTLHQAFPGTITISVHTLQQLIVEIVESMRRGGFEDVVIVNGHGGNTGPLQGAVYILSTEKHINVALVNYLEMVRAAMPDCHEENLGRIGHAGEVETSLQLYLNEQHVDTTQICSESPDAGSTAYRRNLFTVCYPLPFEKVSTSGVMGAGSLASKEKGERIFACAVNELVRFVEEFGTWT